MTKQSFDEIIHRCCKESSDFIQQAKWELLESDEPNSVEVKVSIVKTTITDNNTIKILINCNLLFYPKTTILFN